jgi:hypothetical protein
VNAVKCSKNNDFISVRDDVAEFVIAMEDMLKLHDDRPGWENETDDYLTKRLDEEIDEAFEYC